MIKFFKKIRQGLLSEGKTGKYFKYAIGEIVLVMIGILLALQVNRWKEQSNAYKTEEINLMELLNNVNQDIEDLEYNLDDDSKTINSINAILTHVNNSGKFHDSLAYHFGIVSRYTNFINNTSAYESLKSIGLNSIMDSKLRFQIISYYENDSKTLLTVENEFINSAQNKFIKPLKIKYFDFNSKFGQAYPKDFEKLLMEGNLKSILVNLKYDFEWKIELTTACLNKAKNLVAFIKNRHQ